MQRAGDNVAQPPPRISPSPSPSASTPLPLITSRMPGWNVMWGEETGDMVLDPKENESFDPEQENESDLEHESEQEFEPECILDSDPEIEGPSFRKGAHLEPSPWRKVHSLGEKDLYSSQEQHDGDTIVVKEEIEDEHSWMGCEDAQPQHTGSCVKTEEVEFEPNQETSQMEHRRGEKRQAHSQLLSPGSKRKSLEIGKSDVEGSPCNYKPKMNKSSQAEKLPWTRDSKTSLLALVRENRNLWDHKDPLFLKLKSKQNTFKAVADTLKLQYPELSDLNEELAHQKFKNLRTYFHNLCKKYQQAPSGSSDHPTHKWSLFDSASFMMDSFGDVSNSISSLSVTAQEKSSSEPGIVASLTGKAGNITDQDDSECVLAAPGIETSKFKGTVTSPSSFHPTSACANLSKATPHSLQKHSIKCAIGSPKHLKNEVVTNDSADKCMNGFNHHLQRKQKICPMAVSMGLLVEAVVDKLSHPRQLWFAQKLTNLVAEAYNLPIQTD